MSIALLAIVARPLATDDTWWHLALGDLYLREGLWPDSDPMLHTTSGREPVQHEWLFQVGLHSLETIAGFHGLRVVHALAVAGILIAAFRLLAGAGRSLPAAALAALLFAAVSWFRLIQLRPELFSLPAILALYALLLAEPRPPSWRRVAASAALFLVWANAHSLFAVGLALLLAAALGTGLWAGLALRVPGARQGPAWAENAARGRRLVCALGLGLGVSLLNPRGPAQLTHFFTESRAGSIWRLKDDFLPYDPLVPTFDNAAFSPLAWGLMNALLLVFCAVAARSAWRLWSRRSPSALRDLDPVHLGLAAAAWVACFVAVRFHWLAFFPLVYVLRALRPRLPVSRAAWACALASVVLAAAIPPLAGFGSFRDELRRERLAGGDYWRSRWLDQRYCGPGMRFLRDTGLEGRLFNAFNLGGFLGYWVSPRLRTFIDGRLDHYPPQVLDDYLAIRRTSRRGPSERLRALLDARKVDVFFADHFPEREYRNRFSGTHLRRLPDWVPVFAARTHSIYLRRSPENRDNLRRVAAYYRERGVPFDPRQGLDVDWLVRESPRWAIREALLPRHYDQMLQRSREGQGEARLEALRALGDLYWRIGALETQVPVDVALLAARPGDKEAKRRLADALLQLGRFRRALEIARSLFEQDPEYRDAAYLHTVASQALRQARRERASRRIQDALRERGAALEAPTPRDR